MEYQKPQEKKTRITVLLTPERNATLKKIAGFQGVSVNALLNGAIDEIIETNKERLARAEEAWSE